MNLWRKKAHDRFLALGFPKAKQEAFQYLPMSKLQWPQPAAQKNIAFDTPESTLVFVDGFFDPALSKLPSEAICLPLDQALKSYGLFLQNRWTRSLKEEKDPLCLLNAADHGRGAFFYLPPNVHAAVNVLHIATCDQLASPRLQISLGKNSSLSLMQSLSGGFSNGAVDLALDAGAQVKFYDTQLLPSDAHSFMALRATLKRDARLEVFHATDGAKAVRFSAQAELLEENSSFLFRTLSMLTGERESHIYALADHAAPLCTSRQHIKTALNGQSRSSFEGKIYVRSPAQKTEAYQLNNNLLLSETATANAKPNLEIFADDVKASHGATFAQLSDEELFYLRCRGLPLAAAKSLLMQGFCRETIDDFPLSLQQPLLEAMARAYA